MKNHAKTALALVVGSLGISNLVQAQDFGIEEVVVTAQKRAQSMQDIPVSVSALSDADLEGLKLGTGADIAAHVPNLAVNQPYGEGTAPVFSLRGVTTTDYSHNQSSPVAMYVDEVYKSVGALQSLQIFDLERIEVLRGPQGSLYGKNATGGAVNFIAKKPVFEEAAYLTLGIGNYHRQEAKGAYQTSLIDDVLATRMAFTYTKADGITENKYPGGEDQGEIDQWAYRLGFLYQPRDDLEAYLRITNSRSTGQNHGVFAGNIEPWLGVDRSGLDFDENASDRDVERVMENTGVALTVNWDINAEHSFTSITSYDEGEWLSPEDDDGMAIDLDHNDYNSEVRQYTQEFRITSDYSGPFNWIGGIFWGKDIVEADSTLRLWNDPSLGVDLSASLGTTGLGLNYTNDLTQTRTSAAGYLHTTYALTDALTLTVGLRYTEDDTEVSDYTAAYGATVPGEAPNFAVASIGPDGYAGPAPKVDFTDRNTSGKIGLDWVVNEDVMTYVSYSQGYRSGAVNAQAFFAIEEITTVDPEELEAWELGVKSRFFDNRVQLNGAIFRYEYTDQQYLDTLPGGLAVLLNAEKSQITGLELEATVQASEDLALRLGLGYTDGEIKELVLEDGTDLAGNELISTPELSVTAAVDWRFWEIDAGIFSMHLDTSFSDEVYTDIKNTDRVALDDYWLTNGRLTFDAADDSYSVSAWVKNLTDEEYLTYGLDLAQYGLGFDYFSRGLPRTFGLEVTFRM